MLVVDDEPSSLRASRRVLAAYRVFFALNTDDACRVIRDECPDVAVVVMDLNFPGEPFGGLHAIRAVRRLAPTAAVVLYTAFPERVARDQVWEEGACVYCPKGEPGDLVRAVGVAVETSERLSLLRLRQSERRLRVDGSFAPVDAPEGDAVEAGVERALPSAEGSPVVSRVRRHAKALGAVALRVARSGRRG